MATTVSSQFVKKGWNHNLIERRGDIALYERFKSGLASRHWEVVRIRPYPAYTLANIEFPEGERYPASESWGRDGFTYRDLESATRKFNQLVTG